MEHDSLALSILHVSWTHIVSVEGQNGELIGQVHAVETALLEGLLDFFHVRFSFVEVVRCIVGKPHFIQLSIELVLKSAIRCLIVVNSIIVSDRINDGNAGESGLDRVEASLNNWLNLVPIVLSKILRGKVVNNIVTIHDNGVNLLCRRIGRLVVVETGNHVIKKGV